VATITSPTWSSGIDGGGAGPAAAGAYVPSVMGKNRLFHAFSSSWFLYW
jgi:hypothetical protein